VLAVVKGRVGYSGERGLGGKQVWLREGAFKNSFYYAHLDSINVSVAEKVSIGDTLGFVGNTGNARTTTPHLHFGIYSGGTAIDPLPFIRRTRRKKVKLEKPSSVGYVVAQEANVRLGPSIKGKKLRTLDKGDTITILGRTANWYHAKLPLGSQGFVYHFLVSETENRSYSELSSK